MFSSNVDDDFDFEYDYAKAAQNRSECWTDDNWEKEMEKHPLFMSKAPEPGNDSPLVDALTQLKYDPNLNSVCDLMESYKNDGNENFKCKKYKWAVDSYSEGIRIAIKELRKSDSSISLKEKENIRHLLSILYNNRASAHYYQKNYRSSELDARRSLLINSRNFKACVRIPTCLIAMKKYDKCIDFCNKQLDFGDKPIFTVDEYSLLKDHLKCASTSFSEQQRDERKLQRELAIRKQSQDKIISAVVERKIKFIGSLFETDHSAAYGHFVHLNDNNELLWPTILIYPEIGVSDFIKDFPENTTFLEQLETMFAEPPEWDPEKRFIPNKLRLFYTPKDSEPNVFKRFDTNKQLVEILSLDDYFVQNAIPVFFVGTQDELRY